MTDEKRSGASDGPVPVRASMGAASSEEPATEQAGKAAEPAAVRRFRHGEEEWLACVAGESAYGTGERGAAYLVAVHFFRASDDATPLKEALIPAARFSGLAEPELRELLNEAVTIDLDREPSAASRQARRSLGGRSPGGRSSHRS